MDLVLIHLLLGGLTEITEGSETVMMWMMTKILRVRGVLGLKMVQTLAGGGRGAERVSGGSGGFVMIGLPSPHIHIMGILIQKIWFYGFFNIIWTCINRYVNSIVNAVKFSWDLPSAVQCFVVNLKHAKMLFYWRLSLKISSMTWQFLCMHEKICIQQQYKTW